MKRVIAPTLVILTAVATAPTLAQENSVHSVRSGNAIAAQLAPFDARLQPLAPLATAASKEPVPGILPLPKYGRWVGITKWITLGAAVGLGALGFSLHSDANQLFDRLEALCEADADNCRKRRPDGAYVDPQLENLYQDVLDRDRLARLSLIGAEVNFGASVLLFIVDFQRGKGPSDIPYDPDEQKTSLRLTALPGEIALRYYIK